MKTDCSPLRAAVFDIFPSQLAVLNTDGVIVKTNDAWRSFGLDNGIEIAPEMVGENYLTVCRASDDPSANDAADGIEAVIEGTQDEFRFEYPCHTPDEQRWFMMRAIPFQFDDEGHVLVMHIDITERRLAESAVEDRNDTLEMVSGVMSHDLRNPLSVALARTDMLPENEHTAAIERSLERMNAIVEDALLLASERDVETADCLSIESIAREAWEQVATGDATLSIDTERMITGDRNLVIQLLENLFRNAIEHAGDGTIIVGGCEDGFYVADAGPGIPPADREQVFEPGYTTNKRDETGLGLSIVRHIADAHGWDVTATDGETGGARIEITGVDAGD